MHNISPLDVYMADFCVFLCVDVWLHTCICVCGVCVCGCAYVDVPHYELRTCVNSHPNTANQYFINYSATKACIDKVLMDIPHKCLRWHIKNSSLLSHIQTLCDTVMFATRRNQCFSWFLDLCCLLLAFKLTETGLLTFWRFVDHIVYSICL